MTNSCIFCRIVEGSLPATFVYQDESVVAFEDRNPQAPTHILVVPRLHVATLADATASHEPLLGRILFAAARIARERGLASGYRAVINNGEWGGQTVFHVHLHLMGGRQFHWPPG